MVESIEDVVWTPFVYRFLIYSNCSSCLVLFSVLSCLVMIMTRHAWLVNSDSNTLWNALFVSVLCGLTESVTISNFDNFTIFGMGILSYNYVHCFVCCI